MKIVKINWVDSTMRDAWQDKQSPVTKMERVQSVGYLISKSKKKIVISQGFTSSQVGMTMSIPMGCVTKIKRIKK